MRTLSQRNSPLLRLNENKRGSVPPNVIGCDTNKRLALFVKGSLVLLFSRFRSNQSTFFLRIYLLSTLCRNSYDVRFSIYSSQFASDLVISVSYVDDVSPGTNRAGRYEKRKKKKYANHNDAVPRTCFVIIWITDCKLYISMIYNQSFCTSRR